MTRSFRFKLALRATLAVTVALGVLALATFYTLRTSLDREIDSSILNIASIQAGSLADGPGGEMHFHEWELTPEEAESVRDIVQYAQVWGADGASLLRSRYMTRDLPLDPAELRRAAAGELVFTTADFAGGPVRTLYYPLERLGPAHEAHVLQVAAPLSRRNQMLRRAAWFFLALAGVAGAGSFVGAWWLAGSAVRPIHEIIDQAEDIGARSLDHRIEAYADTVEYRRLVEVLNTMLERLQGAFESQRRFIADASHELRSPLTALRGEIEVALRRDREPSEYRAVLRSTLEEAERLSALSNGLLTLARSDSATLRPRVERVRGEVVIERVVERLKARAEQRSVTIRVEGTFAGEVEVDPGMLGQITWNLVDNAIRYSPEQATVTVRLSSGEAEGLCLVVEDAGPGLRGIASDAVWDRFSRGDPVRTPRHDATTSAGLGLAIVKALTEAHGGWVRAENRNEGGASFTVLIPAGPAS